MWPLFFSLSWKFKGVQARLVQEPHKAIIGSELLVSALPASTLGFSVGAQHGPSGAVSGNHQSDSLWLNFIEAACL